MLPVLWSEFLRTPWLVAVVAAVPAALLAWWLRGEVDHFKFYRVRRPVKTQDPRRVLRAMPTLGPGAAKREAKP